MIRSLFVRSRFVLKLSTLIHRKIPNLWITRLTLWDNSCKILPR